MLSFQKLDVYRCAIELLAFAAETIVAVAVHVNVAVNDHGRSASAYELLVRDTRRL